LFPSFYIEGKIKQNKINKTKKRKEKREKRKSKKSKWRKTCYVGPVARCFKRVIHGDCSGTSS